MLPPNFEVRSLGDFTDLQRRLGPRATVLTDSHAWRALVPLGDYPGWWSGVDWFIHGDPVDIILGIIPTEPGPVADWEPRLRELAGATVLAEGFSEVQHFDPEGDELVIIPAGADPAALSQRIRRVSQKVRARIGVCLSCGQRRHLGEERLCNPCWAIKYSVLY